MTEKTPNKASNKKRNITIGVIAFLAVCCIGFWAWHETPSFCGTACHDTMNEHLANYEGTDESGGAGLAHVHAVADDPTSCMGCHKPELSAQISEFQAQVSGSYDMDELQLSAAYFIDNQTCLDCHEGTYEALSEKTAKLGDYNPHANPHGQMNCNECHKGHSAQINTCGQCHDNHGQEMKA